MPQDLPKNKYADVPLRIKSWGVIICIFALAISHPYMMYLFCLWVSFQALTELGGLFSFDVTYWRIGIPLLQGILLLVCPTYYDYMEGACLIIGIGLILALLLRKTSLGIPLSLVIVLAVYPHLTFLRMLPQGWLWVIFLVVTTELNDIFQYLTGKSLGKRKILPKISPNKTIEGFAGGLLLTPLLSIGLGTLLGLSISMFTLAIIGLAISFFGFWGDVTFSYLKRRAGVKDTGTLIPAHGGLLDRIDSLLYNCIWFYLWIR